MTREPQGADAVTAHASHAATATSGVNVLLAGLSVKFSFKLVGLWYLNGHKICCICYD